MFIQKRIDKKRKCRFDFVLPSATAELKQLYDNFLKDKRKFVFSNLARAPMCRGLWLEAVDVLYCPVQIERTHWLGIIINLKDMDIKVLDSNKACLTDQQVQDYLLPISVMFPYLIHRHGLTPAMQSFPLKPLPVSRKDVPFSSELPGKTYVYKFLGSHICANIHST